MKENRRKDDLEQLKKQRIILQKIIGIQLLIVVLSFFVLALWEYKANQSHRVVEMVIFVVGLFYVIMFLYIIVIQTKLNKKLAKIKKAKIMEMVKDGNLKKFLKPKNEIIIQRILSTQIKQILFKDCTKKELKAEMIIGNNKLLYPICFPKEKILALIDREGKNRILESVIDSITIDELEDEIVKINIKPINSKPITVECCYDQLMEYFDVKK